MSDTRAARKAAEKAARERLGASLIAAVGELGAAAAQQQAAAASVAAAEDRAREHVRRAQGEAERMVAAARDDVGTAEESYQQAHQDALTAGWSAAALHDMGYRAPAQRRRPRPRGTVPDGQAEIAGARA